MAGIPQFPPLAVTLRDGASAMVRSLAVGDGDALADFYSHVPRGDLRFYFPHPLDREHALAIAAQANSPLRVTLVLELPDGRIGGYAWYRWASPEAERSEFGICIASGCKGAGAGRLLMTHLIALARHFGPSVMGLTVQLANPLAVALYQRMGFTIVREQMVKHHPSLQMADELEYAMELRLRVDGNE